MRMALAGLGAAALMVMAQAAPPARTGGTLANMTWRDAEVALTPASVVVIPLGAGSVQHGPHMKLDAGDRLARYLADRILAATEVVIAPSLTYHFYPAFVEYPGSTSLSQNTARDMTIDVVRGLAKYGPQRFYVLNTGTSSLFALRDAADALAHEGILLGYTDMSYWLANARAPRQQTPVRGAPHADEIATSMMLFVDPAGVDMRKAVREYGSGSGPMTRQQNGRGMFSASGVNGDPTVATREKGQALVEAVVAGALEDISAIRNARLPVARPATPIAAPSAAPRPQPARASEQLGPNGCLASDERAIRAVGDRFSSLWRQMDVENLAVLFTDTADMRHPDGTIEKSRETIRQNRLELFRKAEFRGSVHPVTLADIRCLGPGVAIADGRWELRLEDPPATPAPPSGAVARNIGTGRRHSGYCTLILTGGSGNWSIQAWRYTVNPPDGTQAPTTLKQPGFIGRGGG